MNEDELYKDELYKENKYLKTVLNHIDETIYKEEQEKPIYNRYAVQSDYTLMEELRYSKNECERKIKSIDRKIDFFKNFKSNLYEGKLEYREDDEVSTYYITPNHEGIESTELQHPIISWASEVGRKYRNCNELVRQGDSGIVLKRVIAIDNEEVIDIVDEYVEDDISIDFDIKDKFLKRILEQKRKTHKLTNIISSIQAKQNTIIEMPFKSNIVVQGCAGSGKTVIMMHRLSYLKYHMKDRLNFSKVKVITPNENFNYNISSLSNELGVSDIDLLSIEEYYNYLINKINPKFAIEDKKLEYVSKKSLDNNLIKYIYSDEFIQHFISKYNYEFNNIISEKDKEDLLQYIDYVSDVFNNNELFKYKSLVNTYDIKYIDKLKSLEVILKEYVQKTNIKKLNIDENDIKLEELKEKENIIERHIEKNKSIIMRMVGLIKAIGKNESKQNSDSKVKYIYESNKKAENKSQPEIVAENIEKYITHSDYNKCLNYVNSIEMILKKYNIKNYELLSQITENIIKLLKEYDNTKIEIERLQDSIDNKNNLEEEIDIANIENIATKIRKVDYFKIYNNILKELTGKSSFDFKYNNRAGFYTRLLFLKLGHKAINIDDRLICIDEGQNISNNEYKLLKDINGKNTYFNIYGDLNQVINKNEGLADWSQLPQEFNFSLFELNENYRNTNQITEYCNKTFNTKNISLGIDGELVEKIIEKEIYNTIRNLNINKERVAVIISNDRNKLSYLNKNELNLNVIYDTRDVNGKICVLNVDDVKGLEFDIVFVDDKKMSRNEMYISYTRALNKLYIVE